MPERTCAKCGKKGNFERLCKECWLTEHSLLESFKSLDAEVCARCDRLHLGNKWVASPNIGASFETIFKRNAHETQGVQMKALDLDAELPDHTKNEGVTVKGELHVSVTAHVNEVRGELTQDYDIPVMLVYTVCRFCSKAGTDYFEGILQLRNASERIKDLIVAEIAKRATKGVHITQEKVVKGGYDLYLTSNSFLKAFAKQANNQYGGELKISAKLFSRDKLTSKEMFRVNALLRFPDFTKGDVVVIENRVIAVSSVAGKKLYGTDLSTGKRVNLQHVGKQVKRLEQQKTQVSRVRPHIEVLDPESYQGVRVENPEKKVKPGDEVRIVKRAGRVFLV